MAKGSNIGAVVILGILAVAGLGLSGYMFINDQFLGGDEHNMLVAVWDETTGSGSDYNVSFNDNQLAPNDYVSLSNGNESITLTQEGWYKFTFNTYWSGLIPTDYYSMVVYKNGTLSGYAAFFGTPPTYDVALYFEYYVYSDGDDSFYFNCFSSGDVFTLPTNHQYDQVALEYVVTV